MDHNCKYKIWSLSIGTHIACIGDFLGFGTCFERQLHCAILQVCLFIVECSLFVIHYLVQLLDFVEMEFEVGFWVSLGVSKIHID